MALETADGADYHSSDMTKEPLSEKKREGDVSDHDSPSGARNSTVYLHGSQFWMVSIAYVFLIH